MEGSKVIAQEDYAIVGGITIRKGSIGQIAKYDTYNDVFVLMFEKCSNLRLDYTEFMKYFKIIKDERIVCPVVLKKWAMDTDKYMSKEKKVND